eukprot:SAG31_NODE_952_length_10807_cov_4.193127_2_plen_151_part_00
MDSPLRWWQSVLHDRRRARFLRPRRCLRRAALGARVGTVQCARLRRPGLHSVPAEPRRCFPGRRRSGKVYLVFEYMPNYIYVFELLYIFEPIYIICVRTNYILYVFEPNRMRKLCESGRCAKVTVSTARRSIPDSVSLAAAFERYGLSDG